MVPKWDCYEHQFCLVGDRRAVKEILSDISLNPSPLPPHQFDFTKSESTSASVLVLDIRPPETMPESNRVPAASQYEEEFWRAEGVEINPNYKGYMRCSIDETGFLWKDVIGDEDLQENIYAYARRADKRSGGVYKVWHCCE